MAEVPLSPGSILECRRTEEAGCQGPTSCHDLRQTNLEPKGRLVAVWGHMGIRSDNSIAMFGALYRFAFPADIRRQRGSLRAGSRSEGTRRATIKSRQIALTGKILHRSVFTHLAATARDEHPKGHRSEFEI